MSVSVTHLSGPIVIISGRLVQRCAVCGEKLVDNKHAASPIETIEEADAFGAWEERHYVRIDGPESVDMGDFLDSEVPVDFCLALVE